MSTMVLTGSSTCQTGKTETGVGISGHITDNEHPILIVDAINSVSRRKGESYEDFIQRAKLNEIGRRVKLADMRDNCDLFRMHELPDKHLKMIKKYHTGIKELEPNHTNRISI